MSLKKGVFKATSEILSGEGGQRPPPGLFSSGSPSHKGGFFSGLSSSTVDDFDVQVKTGADNSAAQYEAQNPFFQRVLEEDLHFANQVKSLELMLRVRERLESGAGESAVCADSHPAPSPGRDVPCVRVLDGPVPLCQFLGLCSVVWVTMPKLLMQLFGVPDEPAFARSRSLGSGSAGSIGRELQSARPSGPSVRLHAHATAGGLREISESDSPLLQSINSSMVVPGLQTLLTAGLHNTLRPVHWQAWWVVFSQRVCKVWSSQIPVGWGRRK